MTTEEIVKRLREYGDALTDPVENVRENRAGRLMLKAADRLEALEAENKRLREAYIYTDGAFWFLVFDGRQLGPFAERDDARAALKGEKT
jgi:hypothetical protein